MNREELSNDILAYADGQLAGERAAAVEQAMADSAAVRAEVEQWRQLRQAANRALYSDHSPHNMQRRIAAQISALRPENQTFEKKPVIFRIYQPMMAAAAAIVIAFGFYLYGPSAQNAAFADPEQFPSRHMICLNNDNYADDLNLRQMSPATAQAALTAQHQYPVLVPDLSEAGWQLQAGRLCGVECSPGQDGSKWARMVHVFYTASDDPSKSISLFSLERRVEFPNPCAQVKGCGGSRLYHETNRKIDQNQFAVISWCEPKNSYAACGQVSNEELRTVLEDVQVAIADNRVVMMLASQN